MIPFNSSGLDHLNHLDRRQSLEIGLSALSVDTAREAESMGGMTHRGHEAAQKRFGMREGNVQEDGSVT